MLPKERWQALQARLSAARAFVDAGDRAHALQQIDAALAIDPEYLAAQTLRERILSPAPAPQKRSPAPAPDELSGPAPLAFDLPLRPPEPVSPPAVGPPAASAERIASAVAPAASPAPPLVSAAAPVVNAAGYAKFEQRAKRRRVDRRLEAARIAIERRRLKEAGAAIDEVMELDPNVPELVDLTLAFDNLRRSQSRTPAHRGPSLAAAAVFAAIVLGATWIDVPAALLSHPFTAISSLVSSTAPVPIEEATPEVPVDLAPVSPPAAEVDTAGTSGRPASDQSGNASAVARQEPVREPVREPVQTPASLARPPADSRDVVPATAPPPPPAPSPTTVAPEVETRNIEPLPNQAKVEAPRIAREDASSAPAAKEEPSAAAAVKVAAELDESLVRQALQRYRVAYDGLDARSAQAVWPAVNRSALARAFDGLESQRLTFESCELQLLTDTATATCRGTARYVPKIGNREPRVEPRVWTFSLRRAGNDWKIDSARVQP